MGGLRDAIWGALGTIPRGYWHAFTWLGDSGLLLPVAALLPLLLLRTPSGRRTALEWCLAFGLGSVLIAGSKLAFMGWGIGSARFNFTGFSGHTAIATSVWSMVFWVMTAGRSPRARTMAVVAGCALGACIGISRLAIHAHSVSEVVAGWLLGMAIVVGFVFFGRLHSPPRLPWYAMAACLLIPLAFQTPGTPAQTQGLLERIAVRLAGTERPYTRRDMLQGRLPVKKSIPG
jgi:membrane-associated phospholipid phosphatase